MMGADKDKAFMHLRIRLLDQPRVLYISDHLYRFFVHALRLP